MAKNKKQKPVEVETPQQKQKPVEVVKVSNGVTTGDILDTDLEHWIKAGWKKV